MWVLNILACLLESSGCELVPCNGGSDDLKQRKMLYILWTLQTLEALCKKEFVLCVHCQHCMSWCSNICVDDYPQML